MVKWKLNVRNGKVIYGKEGFRFYILYNLNYWQNFAMKICLSGGRGKVDILTENLC